MKLLNTFADLAATRRGVVIGGFVEHLRESSGLAGNG
jgi:hypothetical protein